MSVWSTAFTLARGAAAIKSLLLPVGLVAISATLAYGLHSLTTGAAARAELEWVRTAAIRMEEARQAEADSIQSVIAESSEARARIADLEGQIEMLEVPAETETCPAGCTIPF